MTFDDIHLLKAEKHSLFSFRFKKKQHQEEIKCFESLYHKYRFIESNYYKDRADDFGFPVPDGTYSLSVEYLRYRVYLREKRFQSLPNWVAIAISLLAFLVSVISVWLQFQLSGL